MDEFNVKCTRKEVALSAIWIMYRRGMWQELASIGLPREKYEPLFRAYESRNRFNRHGYLRSTAQAMVFGAMDRQIVSSASRLVGLYIMLYGEENPAILKEKYRDDEDLFNESTND